MIMDNIVIVAVIFIVLFGLVFRRQGSHIGRFMVVAVYCLVGVSFTALGVGLCLQAMQTEDRLPQALFCIMGVASSALGLKFLQDMVFYWRE
jgi:hypothetical protein